MGCRWNSVWHTVLCHLAAIPAEGPFWQGRSWTRQERGCHGEAVWTPSTLGIAFQVNLMTLQADAPGKWANLIVVSGKHGVSGTELVIEMVKKQEFQEVIWANSLAL